MNSRIFFAATVFATVIATAVAIYFTPLRHVTFISPTMHEMDPKVFYEDFKANPDKYILIDVRSENIYQSAHAEGAINVPIENFFDEHYTLPRSGKQIALICTTGRLAAIAYGYMQNWGFRNLVHIQGGMVNWAAEGLPIVGKNISQIGGAADEHQ
ncbi:rhodanese-like domain-containing protein [Candidatus Kaiserbacteria bacterium]|nr:rhodanese-like domain-containing protein [Candidatus Kaiserbacteria bacterium]